MAPTTYAQRLQAAIDRTQFSKRKVATLLAARTKNLVEDERSALYRYLKETEPTPDRAAMLAEILGDPTLAEVKPVAQRRRSRQAALEAEVNDLKGACVALLRIAELLAEQVGALGGEVPRDALEAAALAMLRTQSGARRP